MDIQIKTNLKDIQAKMNRLQKKDFPKVISEGLNYTGAKIVNAHRHKLLQVLDKPMKSSITAVTLFKYAKPKKDDLSVTVGIKDYAARFLYYIYTGESEPARREGYPSPTRAGLEKANKYGNIQVIKGGTKGGTKGVSLRRNIDKTTKSNRANSRFMGKPKGSSTYGIWQRTGRKGQGGLELLVAFTPFIKHRKFLDWFKLSIKVTKNNLYKEINKQMIKRIKRTFG